MSDAIARYFADLGERLAELGRDEAAALDVAADVCARALAGKHVIHLHDTGHIVSHEMVRRTGGLVVYTPFTYGGALDNPNLYRAGQNGASGSLDKRLAAERALLEWVFAQATLQPGDVLIIGSVSGAGWRLIELALQAKERGLTVIAITAPAHSGRLAPQHPCGKRLFEVADIVLDNHAQYGDSFFEIDGFETKVAAISGLAAAALMWALTVGVVERLVAQGIEPSVYTSINLPDGPAAVERIEARYRELGY